MSYFAELPSAEIGRAIRDRVDSYYDYVSSNGLLVLWRESYRQYHAANLHKGGLFYSGERGERRGINFNKFRNILTHLKVIITQQRPTFQAKAANSDYSSLAQATLAAGILDYYLRQKREEVFIGNAVISALIFGEGWMSQEWDDGIGPMITLADGRSVPSGDVVFSSYGPLDVVRDVFSPSVGEHEWFIVRKVVNKYSLAKKYEQFADKITSIPSVSDHRRDYYLELSTAVGELSDMVPLYCFYHKKTPTLPEGRQVFVAGDDLVIFDGVLPYTDLPLYVISPEFQSERPFGYSVAFDLLPLQKVLNSLHSTIVTNQNAFGLQNVVVDKGSNVGVSALVEGLRLIEKEPGREISPLSLLNTPAEVFSYAGAVERQMDVIAGVSQVLSGQLPDGEKLSGSALALLSAQSVQFNSSLQQSYVNFLEDVGTGMVNILKRYASTPRLAMIAGKFNQSYLREFTGKDIELVDRVVVDVGNPIINTVAGREQMAQTLLSTGIIKDPQEYINVLKTGSIEPLVEGPHSELMLIRAENEALREGKSIVALATDDHPQHIVEHRCVLSSPDSRENPDVVMWTLQHINEHINALKVVDPHLLAILNIKAIIKPQPVDAPPAANVAPDAPSQPRLPDNPATGEEYVPGEGMTT